MKTSQDKKDLAEAQDRAQRAKKYAAMFPNEIRPTDLKFQNIDWQLTEVKRFNRPCAPQKE